MGTIINPILQMRKPRDREKNQLEFTQPGKQDRA